MSNQLFRSKERGQTLVEVLGIAATVLVVLLAIMWAVDKYRAQETKVSVPSSLNWAQGQAVSKPITDILPGSNDTFNAVPQTIEAALEGKIGQQSGAVAEGENQSAAQAGKSKGKKTDPVMDLNAANAAMETALMGKMMRRSNDAYQLGLDRDDSSAPLKDKNKEDDEKILIPGVSSNKDNQ